MKKFLLDLLLFFFLLKLFTPTNVLAQGTHRCTFLGSQVACAPADVTCDTANSYFTNDAYCNRFDPQPGLPGGNPSGCNNAAYVACITSAGPQQYSCPSSNLPCIAGTGQPIQCNSPCIRVVTQYGGPRGGQAVCACQIPNQSGTVPLGGACQNDSDCAPPGQYCWGPFNGTPTCNTEPRQIGNQQGGEQENFCDSNGNPTSDSSSGELYTAIGCIPADNTNNLIAFFLRWAVGIGGGIAFLLAVVAGFMIMSSSGNPERLQAGKELLTSAIAGIILLIFSVFILRVIGVDILQLPGIL